MRSRRPAHRFSPEPRNVRLPMSLTATGKEAPGGQPEAGSGSAGLYGGRSPGLAAGCLLFSPRGRRLRGMLVLKALGRNPGAAGSPKGSGRGPGGAWPAGSPVTGAEAHRPSREPVSSPGLLLRSAPRCGFLPALDAALRSPESPRSPSLGVTLCLGDF